MGATPQFVIDAHAQFGIIDRRWPQSFDADARQAREAEVAGAALFPPVLEIYDRYDAGFTDTPAWRRRRRESNAHLLSLAPGEPTVYPYFFIRDLAEGILVSIPHLGMLNGGFRPIAEAGLCDRENVWVDTALADRDEIREYLRSYGHRRLMFGSDFPFGDPVSELRKIRGLHLDPAMEAAVLGGNFMRLQARVDHAAERSDP